MNFELDIVLIFTHLASHRTTPAKALPRWENVLEVRAALVQRCLLCCFYTSSRSQPNALIILAAFEGFNKTTKYTYPVSSTKFSRIVMTRSYPTTTNGGRWLYYLSTYHPHNV